MSAIHQVQVLLNNIRDMNSTPDQIRLRQKCIDYSKVAKVITAALGILLVSAALSSGFFGALVLAPILFVATHDIYRGLDNFQQIFKDAMTELILNATWNDNSLRDHLVQNTIVLRHIIK